MAAVEDQYCFKVQWYDVQADLLRGYDLTFYPRDNSVAMYDPKNKRGFLKRSQYAELRLADLHVGGNITVHARQLKILDYGDVYSRRVLETRKARTLGIIKPDAYSAMGEILSNVYGNGLVCGKLNMVRLSLQQAQAFCNLSNLPAADAEHLCSDVIVVMELVGDDAVNRWQGMLGPASASEARGKCPKSIRAVLGKDEVRNAAHGSASAEEAARELEFFFGQSTKWPTTATFNNCTLCVIRPHIIQDGLVGDVISRILSEGFEVSAMRLWHLDKTSVEEFIDVYRGVLPEYQMIVDQMCVGPCLVMEVRRQDHPVENFRQLVGYHDPEVSKHLRPGTLRADFGVDRVRNAVHCTDLAEDGLLEVQFFFNMLYSREQHCRQHGQ